MPFAPGDHLRVRRKRFGLPYTHHAINVGDGRVVEFGGSTANKPAMGIEYSAYEQFAKGDVVDVVRSPDHDPAPALRRAEWLTECPPPRQYDGIGFNCEHVARWCSTGWETESLQIRHKLFGGRVVLIGVPLQLWVAWRTRASRPIQRPVVAAIFVYVGWSLWTHFQYENGIRHFVKHIRENCPRELREASAPAPRVPRARAQA